EAICDALKKFKKDGVTEQEFLRGKEQIKSAFIFGQESNSALMQLYGRRLLFTDKAEDVTSRIEKISGVTEKQVAAAIEEFFDLSKASTATVGPKRTPITL
ncbi:MAG: insulinase family protein, partial [Clostridia bacterium]|nr:insulinase family protein [Clostridia bacterium]